MKQLDQTQPKPQPMTSRLGDQGRTSLETCLPPVDPVPVRLGNANVSYPEAAGQSREGTKSMIGSFNGSGTFLAKSAKPSSPSFENPKP